MSDDAGSGGGSSGGGGGRGGRRGGGSRVKDIPHVEDPSIPHASAASMSACVTMLRSLSGGRHIRTLEGPRELVDLVVWAANDAFLKLTGAGVAHARL